MKKISLRFFNTVFFFLIAPCKISSDLVTCFFLFSQAMYILVLKSVEQLTDVDSCFNKYFATLILKSVILMVFFCKGYVFRQCSPKWTQLIRFIYHFKVLCKQMFHLIWKNYKLFTFIVVNPGLRFRNQFSNATCLISRLCRQH